MAEQQEFRERDRRGYAILVAWVLAPLLVIVVLLVFMLRNRERSVGSGNGNTTGTIQENILASIRSTLARQNDLGTCRTIIAQLNQHVQQAKDHAIPPLSSTERERLRKEFGLSEDDLAEVASVTFTPLDAHHLDSSFLFRDAARSLEQSIPSAAEGKLVRIDPVERAALAFAWVVRQVRLFAADTPPSPPASVLRRGSGNSLERALVFLALLEQFGLEEEAGAGLQGCLLFCPDTAGKERFWACGVLVGTKPDAIYLFDPRLGLPIPGPEGKGVATLAQTRSNPAILGQLAADKLTYDVNAEQAKSARAYLATPLSALAPRIRFLQDRLLRDRSWQDQALPAQVRVRLAEDSAATLTSLRQAVTASAGKPDDVRVWGEGVTVLRRFLPRAEGGTDEGTAIPLRLIRGFTADDDPAVYKMHRLQLFQILATPWSDFPPIFRDPLYFGFNVDLGRRLRDLFSAPFTRDLVDPNSPRELLLRGRFSRAVPELVKEYERWQQLKRHRDNLSRQDLEQGVAKWAKEATDTYAALLQGEATAKGRVEALWKWKANDPIALYFMGQVAEGRSAEVAYQLGLCNHEQAARQQARLDLLRRAGKQQAVDDNETRQAWEAALGPWRECAENHPGRPTAAMARRLRGEALQRLGRTEEAVATWNDVSGWSTELEKLAILWLAKQAQPAGKGS